MSHKPRPPGPSFRISDPEKVYKTLMGNVEKTYKTEWLISQLNSEVKSCFLKMTSDFDFAEGGFRPSETAGIAASMAEKTARVLSEQLKEKRGIEIVSLAFDSFSITDADLNTISSLQSGKVLTNPLMAAATLTNARSEAMKSAASNRLFKDKE